MRLLVIQKVHCHLLLLVTNRFERDRKDSKCRSNLKKEKMENIVSLLDY